MCEKYIISSIGSKNGKYNFYHSEMCGRPAYIILPEVGESAVIEYLPEYNDRYQQVVTSTVESVTDNGGCIVIETHNSIYTMQRILLAEFTSVWDGGFAVTTKCKVNESTKEVFGIEVSEDTADMVNNLDEEYVTINGQDFPVVSDEYMGNDPEEQGGYWYRK